jgi:PhzF family phenazine biosynthesis protein
MGSHRFHQVDVFASEALRGNPLAVVHAAEDLTADTMASFARWTNLSETTFLLPPRHADADYQLRIFTPRGELPFAGHPTLGSCHAWLADGGEPKSPAHVVQECGVGLVRIRRDGERLAFEAPPLRRSGPLDDALLDTIARGIGLQRQDIIRHQWCDNGPGWCAVMLASAQQVLAVQPDFNLLRELKLGLIGPQPEGADTRFEVRAFVAGLGVPEDPVTGSLNAALATWLIGAGLAPEHYVVAQGAAVGRRGRVFVDRIGSATWIGGYVSTRIEGRLSL